MYKHRFNFFGGLGDVIEHATVSEIENLLELDGDERAEIFIASHNPGAVQLFDFHPKRHQIDIKYPGWVPQAEIVYALKRLKIEPFWPQPHSCDMHTHFYESEQDKKILAEIGDEPYYVIAAGAGERFRNIPDELLIKIVERLETQNMRCFMVGADYARGVNYRPENNTRQEPIISRPSVTNLINSLSVPGTMALMRRSKGVICAHSGLFMYMRNIRKPFTLLYPDSVRVNNIEKRDHYSVGVDENNVYCSTFTEFNIGTFDEFIRKSSSLVNMESIVYPYEICRKYNVPRQLRLTHNRDVRFMCHLFEQFDGAFVDIGCNTGLTTRDIAKNFKTRNVYAFDDTATNPLCTKEQREFCTTESNTCREAGYLPNVKFLGDDTEKLRKAENVSIVFIDGCASFAGVKQNTERALALNPKMLVWHDYFESHNVQWLGVPDYINTTNFKFKKLEESTLIYTQLRD